MKLRIDGKNAYIGRCSTSGTSREVSSQYTSREVDVTYSSTSSTSGTYTYPYQTTYESPVVTQTYLSTWVGQSGGPPVVSSSVGTTTVPNGHATSTVAAWNSDANRTTTVAVTVDLTRATTIQQTYHSHTSTTFVNSSVVSSAVGGEPYVTTIEATGTGFNSGQYTATSYTYKDEGYNTWYITKTNRDSGNINM